MDSGCSYLISIYGKRFAARLSGLKLKVGGFGHIHPGQFCQAAPSALGGLSKQTELKDVNMHPPPIGRCVGAPFSVKVHERGNSIDSI